jgi:hypothetical protein
VRGASGSTTFPGSSPSSSAAGALLAPSTPGLNFTGDANTAAVSSLHWDGRAWTAVATPAGVNGTLWSISTRPGNTRLLTAGDSIPGAPLSLERH